MFVGLAPALTRAGPITRECRQNAPPASSAARLFGNPRSPLLLAGQSRACHRSSSHGLAKGQVVYPCAVCELFVARGESPNNRLPRGGRRCLDLSHRALEVSFVHSVHRSEV